MKLNRVLIYLLILVLIGAWLYLVEIKHRQAVKATEEKAAKLITLEKDKVADIRIESGDRIIELKKPANQWVITAPVRTKADEHAVESLLTAALEAKSEKVLAEKDVKFEDYGLDNPELTVTLSMPEKKIDIAFGARNPAKTAYYVRVHDDPRLLLVADTLKNSLDKSIFDLRDKTVMGIAPQDVEKVVISADGKQTELQLEASGKWVMVKPEQLKVKKSVVSRDIMSLTNLQAKDIIDEPQKKGDHYGLDNPQKSILLAGKKLAQTLLIGKAVEKEGKPSEPEPDRYASVKDHDTVYVLDGRTLKDLLRPDPEHLQDRSLLTFDPQAIDKLEVELEGHKWLAVKSKDAKWDLEQPEKISGVDAWPLSSILWDLKDLEWKSIKKGAAENLAAVHLDKPKLLISLFKKDEKEPTVLKAGWEDVKPAEKTQKGAAEAKEEPRSEKNRSQAEKEAQKEPLPEERPDKAVATARPVLPPTVNVLVEPSEEKEALYLVDSGFVDRLQVDLERLLEKKK